MPQHLSIVIGGVTIAHMCTSNRGGTRYDIYWESNQGHQKKFCYRNTGIECQSKNQLIAQEEYKNDFIHAQRSIAAASSTAKKFLNNLLNNVNSNEDNIEEALIILKTNKRERGRITISPNDDQKAKLTMEIGTDPKHPQDEPFIKIKDDIDISGINSSIVMIINVFDSESAWMLNILQKNT